MQPTLDLAIPSAQHRLPSLPARPQAKTIVFVSTCKQARFLFEAFRKLRPGVPLRALHGRMNQYKRMGGQRAPGSGPGLVLLLPAASAWLCLSLSTWP